MLIKLKNFNPIKQITFNIMISEKLKQDALDFLAEVEAVAKDEGYQAAKVECDKRISAMQSECDKRIVEARETYYNEGFKDGQNEHDGEQQATLVIHDGVSYADGEGFSNETSRIVASFAYTRKFQTNWGTIILPVALNYADWSSKFEIAEIVDVEVGKTIVPKHNVLGSGSKMVANRPYLIKAKKSGTQTIKKDCCLLHPSIAGDVVINKDGKTYTFKGTYKVLTANELKGKYYSSGGSFVTATSKCNPMRVILEIS